MKQKEAASAPFNLRLPPDLKTWLAKKADANVRSLHGEVVHRLEESRRQEERGPADATTP